MDIPQKPVVGQIMIINRRIKGAVSPPVAVVCRVVSVEGMDFEELWDGKVLCHGGTLNVKPERNLALCPDCFKRTQERLGHYLEPYIKDHLERSKCDKCLAVFPVVELIELPEDHPALTGFKKEE
jgi:hypothetical protein